MIKYQFFVDKHLPVQTQRKVNISKIFGLFKLIINKATTAMPLT